VLGYVIQFRNYCVSLYIFPNVMLKFKIYCIHFSIKTFLYLIIFIVPVSHIAWHDDSVPFAIAFSSGVITVGNIQPITEPETLTICEVNKR